MTEFNTPSLPNGRIDYAAIEREAHRMRTRAMQEGMRALAGWLRMHLRPRRHVKTPASA